MRGYGNPEVTWALESSLDDLAEQAGIDPVDLRLLNCNEPGETTPMGLKVSTCGLRECLEQTATKLQWKDKRGRGAAKRRGVGVASLIHVGGSGRIYRSDASGIILRLDDFGNVYVSSGGVEMGQGFHSALTLAVADYVGVRPENVVINQTDTSTCPWDVGTHASRGAFTACNAAKMAADKLRSQLFEQAEKVVAKELGKSLAKFQKRHPDYQPPAFDAGEIAKRDRFELRDGVLIVDGAPDAPWARIELGRLLRALHFRDDGKMFTVEALYDPPSELPDWNRGYGNMSATYAYGTQGAEVEVDIETGEVKLLQLCAVHDVGKVLNRQTLEGQTYGALAQGIGYALIEEIQSEQGRILNPDFRDYKIPTAVEMGVPIDIAFVETDDPHGPSGAKGVGEPGLVPTAPAIANAIYDAVGIRLHHLPMTPEKVLAALRQKDET